ncbi:MAG: molybdate ABC transporter substrate-binding protein [Kiloniellales bacterium]
MRLWSLVAAFVLALTMQAIAADKVVLFAAGSLKSALGEVAKSFTEESGIAVETSFGPSGLLRERIEKGEPAQVFASANMSHPRALSEAGKAGPVTLFARNRLCALAQPELSLASDRLLETMLDPAVRVGTSTPKSDPAGDYAFALFGKADALEPGAASTLEAKALKLTGGPDSPKPPQGRNPYGWLMGEKQADIFLTYCTNALLAQAEVPDLEIVRIPEALAVGADYGIVVLKGAPPEGERLAAFILSPAGQAILGRYGFTTTP